MTMKKALLAATAMTAALVVAFPAAADRSKQKQNCGDVCAELDALKAQVEDLRIGYGAQLNELRGRLDSAPQWSYEFGRPTVRTPDGQFELAIRFRTHMDFGTHFQDGVVNTNIAAGERDLASGFNVRRFRLGLEGRVGRNWDYTAEFEFGGNNGVNGASALESSRIGYTGFGNGIRIDLGVFKPLQGADQNTSSNDLLMLERASVVNVMTEAFGGASQRQAIQITWQRENLGYEGSNFIVATGYTGERSGAGVNDGDERTHWTGRAVWRVFGENGTNADSTHVQIGGSWGSIIDQGNSTAFRLRDRPENRLGDIRRIDTGSAFPGLAGPDALDDSYFWSLEAGAQWHNLFLLAEYYDATVSRGTNADAEFNGWYVQGSWVVTGENRRYNTNNGTWSAPRPNSPFVLGATPGAWELAVRYSTIDLDHNAGVAGAATPGGTNPGIRGGEQSTLSLGTNWYVSRNIRFMLNYQMHDVERLNAAGGSLNEDFQALILRSQLAW